MARTASVVKKTSLVNKKASLMGKETNPLPETLMHSIMGKLYNILVNGDKDVPKSTDNFFSWCPVGIPFEVGDFDFLNQGLRGVVKKERLDEITGSSDKKEGVKEKEKPNVTPETLKSLAADDTARLYLQAENFARLVDFVPDASGFKDRRNLMTIKEDKGTLSDIYEYTLKFSQIMESKLSDEIVQKIEKFRALMVTQKKAKDLITDEEIITEEPSQLVKAYNEKMYAYTEAVLEYNAARINALSATDSQAIHYWAMNASTLRNKVKGAMNMWISSGFKADYEKIAAFIEQVMARDMAMLKAEYKDTLEKARLTSMASGSDFFYTSVVPGNFAKAKSWTTFTFESSEIDSHSSSSYNSVATGGSFLGLVSWGVDHQKLEYKGTIDTSSFKLSFAITEVPIVRPWFKQTFLTSKSWRFSEESPDSKDEILSDGGLNGAAPKGILPAYPTSMICIRNLTLEFGESSEVSNWIQERTGVGAFVQFGGLMLGGSYHNGSGSHDYNHKKTSQGIGVDGMQVIGFRCHLLPKSPDPNTKIKDWI